MQKKSQPHKRDWLFIPILVQTIDKINSLIAAAGGVGNGMRRILWRIAPRFASSYFNSLMRN
jgi:hypothetical protein